MAELPSISVVICAFTERRWSALCAAIKAVERQTHPPLETVVVTCDPPGDGVYVGRASYLRGVTAIVVDVYLDEVTAQAFDAITCELVVQAVP